MLKLFKAGWIVIGCCFNHLKKKIKSNSYNVVPLCHDGYSCGLFYLFNPSCAVLKILYLIWCSQSNMTDLLKIVCRSLIMLYFLQILVSILLSTCFLLISTGFALLFVTVWSKASMIWAYASQFSSEMALLVDNSANVSSKTEVHKLISMKPMNNQFQKEIKTCDNLCRNKISNIL